MSQISDPSVRAVFQPDPERPPRALVVAGACGNVGLGKLGQFARLLVRHQVPVIALDLSPQVHEVKAKLAESFAGRFAEGEVAAILANIKVVQGTLRDVPRDLELGFVFEAIPERLDIKRPFYEAVRARDRDPAQRAYIFSATSGLTTHKLFDGISGSDRCGVMHPFFPHLTNKLWEIPTRDGVTSQATQKTIGRMLSSMGMSVIEVRDVPAFAADRIFCGMMLEAVRIHESTGLSPAQIDDACKQLFGTSPFYVHNLIPGSNYLSAHCMELCREEIGSSLFQIPEVWEPYVEDPRKQWPYERGATCPADRLPLVRERLLGMLFSLTAYMLENDIVRADELNFLGENALAFRSGTPALIEEIGHDAAIAITRTFLQRQSITQAERVAPLSALAADRPWWQRIYVDTAVHGEVGLLSLKRTRLNHVFIAELDAALERLQDDPSVKAIVVAPDGKLSREFGHGADMHCFVPVLGNKGAALELIQRWKSTLAKLRRQKPTVAALVGRVLGGSNEMASCCHARIAAIGTRLGQPEPTVGVIPGLGGSHQIHRFSAPHYANRINELLLTGHSFDVSEAVDWGYVSKAVPVRELPQASMAYAAELARGQAPIPPFRGEGSEMMVDRHVDPRNEAGVPLDGDVRELLARTIIDTNRLPYEAASKLEEERAAESLAAEASTVGVKAMMRGKPPAFPRPLA